LNLLFWHDYGNKSPIVRILMIPAFVTDGDLLRPKHQPGAPPNGCVLLRLPFFLVAAISDGLDGYVAAPLQPEELVGVILDPSPTRACF